MSFKSHVYSAWLGELRLIVLIGMFALLPLNVLAEVDTARTTQSSPSEGDPKTISLLGGHANLFTFNELFFETLTRANEDELLEMLEDSRDMVLRSVKDEAIFAIASRFAEIDPQDALAKSLQIAKQEREPFLNGIFSEWCVSNLEEAIAAATKLNRNERLSVLKVMVNVRDDLTEAQLNTIANRLGHPDYASHIESQSKAIEFAEDPITAWSVLVHDGLDDMSQIDTFVLVAEALIETQGFAALFQLHEPFSNVVRRVGETHIFDVVLRELVENDPQDTWEYIKSGLSQPLNQSFANVPAQGQNAVSPREQAYMTDRAQHLLLRFWAEAYPDTVLAEIEQIPHKLQPEACEHALTALVNTDPERTIELIRSLSPYGASYDATLRKIVKRWSTLDPSAAFDWVLSAAEMDNVASYNPGRHPSDKLYIITTVFRSLSLEDPKRALQVAALQEDSEYLERAIINELAHTDAESAIEVLPLVSQSVRKRATESVAEALAERGEVERGMEFLHQYEDTSGEEVSWFWFFWSWADYNAVDLFERLDKLEAKLRTAAAKALGYIRLPGFTQEQLDYIHSIYDWDNRPD